MLIFRRASAVWKLEKLENYRHFPPAGLKPHRYRVARVSKKEVTPEIFENTSGEVSNCKKYKFDKKLLDFTIPSAIVDLH